ncbi:sigma-54-dependent transcriptional regulator [Pseudobacter ginsenosidimutans]|uniref:Two-component system response regulator HydG n=1 Tax=Pseudobacter ginsenosidimutans TaxID=661488 RepID=A0A4V2F1N4_9BACT|nr:sigma-54 dependent transcriptional regulator [Pseudobacter ginsenosidimutans]QEC43035.1 sigma-54-dependent Fis family transcriptional regulator [Pseudobacter ginsenosidimutans]RZS74386.1 two-component system response regulator HydG [Pseudobacter ginsenosidimutans]
MPKVLVIDDDRDICFLMNKFLTKHGYETVESYSAKKALELLEEVKDIDIVLCDYRMEGMDGKTMLLKIKEKYPSMPVIIITGYNDLKTAVDVMKLGAYDYVTKPLFPEEILNTIQSALQQAGTAPAAPPTNGVHDDVKKEKKKTNGNNGDYIFGNSPVFQHLIDQISLVGPTDYSVIIYGESGSGKEAIAQEIHKKSKRAAFPFVAIDCGALSRELAGSELFGHEKGSFTGAINQKPGSFELANGGTIFLDEIANLSYDIQVSLLRVIQERKMRRVGGTKDIPLDVRIIIASNEKLWDAAQKGKFREDLFHRFNEFTIELPPLRQRKDDIMVFARHFLDKANEGLQKNVKGFSPEVEEIFRNYVWHGNLRELRNVVKRAALLTDGDFIEVRSLPFEISNYKKLLFEHNNEQYAEAAQVAPPVVVEEQRPLRRAPFENSLKEASIDLEYELILKALKETNFNKSKAAKLLNIDRKTLYNKIKLYQELNNR